MARFNSLPLLCSATLLLLALSCGGGAWAQEVEAATDDAAAAPPLPVIAAAAAAPAAAAAATSNRVVFPPPALLGKPAKFVPLTEGSGTFVDDLSGEVAGKINTTTARWTPDDLFGSVVSCDRDNKDLVLLHPVRYGAEGPFAVSLWVKAAPAAAAADKKQKKKDSGSGGESLFEYALSHGAGATADAASPSDPFAGPGVHVLLPRGGHGASGLVRAVVKDADDVPGRSFLDSDGRVNDDGDRAVPSTLRAPASSAQPRAEADDGAWHHVAVSSRPEGGDGFLLYVDGRLRGEVPAPPGASPAGETLFADGGGPLKESGLADASVYLCGRSDGAADRFFSGSVAHVSFWDRALDGAGASALFESVPVAGSSSGAAARAAKAAADADAAAAAAAASSSSSSSADAAVAAAVSEQPAPAVSSLLATSSPSASPRKPVFTVAGAPCSFPFNYGGLERWECVPSAADGGASSFCQDAAGHLSRCAAPDSAAELEERFGALRSYLDQYVNAPGGALVAGPDGKVALCSRRKVAGGDGKGSPLLPTECPGGGGGGGQGGGAAAAVVCARLTKSQVARLGPFPSDEARDAFVAGDAGVCARPQGSLLPSEAGDPAHAEKAAAVAALPSSAASPDAAAAAAAYLASNAGLPLPSAYFPLSNYSAAAWPVPELALRNLTLTNTTAWVEDSTFGTALECSRGGGGGGDPAAGSAAAASASSSSRDAAALLPNVPLGPGGAFAVNLWMRQYSSPGAGLQYLFSARASGLDHRQPLDDPAFFMPGQAHLFLPGDEHPGGRHLVRAIVKDTTDGYAGRHSRTFLDSDGAVGSDAPRATPRPALADGEWHMVTLTTLPEGGKGYELYVDGTRRGSLRDPTDYWHVDGGAPIARSAVDVVLCGRSDRSATRFFDGRVAQLALFDEPLSPAAVEALWRAAGGKRAAPPRAGTSASAGVAAEATAEAARMAREADARDAELDAMLLRAKSSGGSGSGGPSAAGGGGGAAAVAAATQATSDESWTAGPVPKPPSASAAAEKHGHGAKHAPATLSSAAKLQAESDRVAALERERREKRGTVSVKAAAAGAAVASIAAAALAAAGALLYLSRTNRLGGGGWRRETLDGREGSSAAAARQPDSPADGGAPGVEMTEGKGKAAHKNPFADNNGSGGGGSRAGGGGGTRMTIDLTASSAAV